MEAKDKRLTFAVTLIIVLLGLLVFEYGYERAHGELVSLREMQMAKTRTLEKYMSTMDERPSLESRRTALKERRKVDDAKIIEADTPSLAAATLQETVKGIITARGGSISSDRVEKPEDLGKFKIVNVSLDAVLPDARALGDVIYGIETKTPSIIVKELDVRVRDFRTPRELVVKMRIAALTGGRQG